MARTSVPVAVNRIVILDFSDRCGLSGRHRLLLGLRFATSLVMSYTDR